MPALAIQPSEICPRFDQALHPALGASVTAWLAYRRRFPRPVVLAPPAPVAAVPEPRKRVMVIADAPAIYAREKPAPVELTPLTPAQRMAAVRRHRRDRLTTRYIKSVCAAFYGLTCDYIDGRIRTPDIVRPRHVAMYLVKTKTDASLPQIGRAFGGRDHTSVLHAYRRIRNELYRGGGTLRDEVEAIERAIGRGGR